MVSRPEKPLDFLIDKLSGPSVKRIFILGPPGSERREYAKKLRENFGLNIIETGSLLKKEVQKKSDLGLKIAQNMSNREYVDDELVYEVVKKKISDCEKDSKNWVIEGFPRTKV